jgi:predicted component of type VI protein secretion system
MAVLIGMTGKYKGQKYEITKDETSIGRSDTNDICFDDASISGQHCLLHRAGQKYRLTDLGSTNGTRVNGAAVTERRLKPKDILQLGSVEVMIDGQDVYPGDQATEVLARVEGIAGPTDVPATFQTTSPFGKRRDSRRPWIIVIAILGVLVIAALVLFLMRIFGS